MRLQTMAAIQVCRARRVSTWLLFTVFGTLFAVFTFYLSGWRRVPASGAALP